MSAPRLHLMVGEEELLLERAVHAVFAAAREVDSEAELRRVRITDLTPGEFNELVSPSLFAQARVLVLDAAHEAGAEITTAVTTYVADPTDGITLVAVHTGGGRGKALADALRGAGAEVTQCQKLTRFDERVDFVRAEVRRAGGKISQDAANVLIDAVGTDLREVAAAASQLVADAGGTIDAPAVRRYHRGRAEVTGFAVGEKAVSGDRAGALEALRWALTVGVAPVLVADALADAVRTVARVGAAGRGDPYRLAGQLGMPPWKVRKAQAQVRGWRPDGLASALAVVAEVNADVKGAAADAGYALERAVLRVAAARSAS